VFELVEEALDEIAITVKERAERRDALAVRHRLYAFLGAAVSKPVRMASLS
jgi:hypothetical protein